MKEENQNPDLNMLSTILSVIYHFTYVDENGEVIERRYQVGKIDSIKIEIFPLEHPPPHFHVRSKDFNASFSIIECKLLTGVIDSDSRKKIEYFHKQRKDKLIECWNRMRPSDSPVGPIIV